MFFKEHTMPANFSQQLNGLLSMLAEFFSEQLPPILGYVLMNVGYIGWSLIFGIESLSVVIFEFILLFIYEFLAFFGFWIFIILFFTAVQVVMGIKMGQIAKMKGHKFSTAFLMCFFLGIFGYIYVLSIPDLKERKLHELSKALLEARAEQQ